MHSITIVQGPTALVERPRPPVEAPEAVIREARRRRRRRWGIVASALVLAVMASIAVAASVSGGTGHPPHGQPPVHSGAPPPVPPTIPSQPVPAPLVVGAFGGSWHVHETSVTISTDGTGRFAWPGTPTAGQSLATAAPNAAQLRLTSVNGMQASGIITNSTDPAELPDGPVSLDVTSQDLLRLNPSQAVTLYPLQWAALCGSAASALTVTQQDAAGINCGA